jgi:hypothetical protein
MDTDTDVDWTRTWTPAPGHEQGLDTDTGHGYQNSASRHPANFESGFRSQFRHCALVSGSSTIP